MVTADHLVKICVLIFLCFILFLFLLVHIMQIVFFFFAFELNVTFEQ